MSLVFLEENKKAVLSSVEDLLKGLNLYFEDKEGFLLAIQKINNLVEDYYKYDRQQEKLESKTIISDSGETIKDLRSYISELKFKLSIFRKIHSLSKTNNLFVENKVISEEAVITSIYSYEETISALEQRLNKILTNY